MFEALIPAEWSRAIAAMAPLHFWLLTLLALAGGAGGFYGIFRFLQRARLVEDLPTSKIRSAAQGYVELEGLAELLPGEPIMAPVTGQRCVWFSYKVEERVADGNSRGGDKWRVIDKGTSRHIFRLVDDTGECIIDPEGAEVIPTARDQWYGDQAIWTGGAAPQRGWARHFSAARYRYTEQRIHPTDDLHAIGWFTTSGGNQELPDTALELRALLREWKRDQPQLLARFDANGDGVIDQAEWGSAQQQAYRQVLREQAQRQRRPPTHLLSRPADGRAYILSTLPQAHLAQRYRRYSFAALLLFLLSGAAATWLLAIHFTLR